MGLLLLLVAIPKLVYKIFKHPKTDDGTKNSLKGLIAVYQNGNGIYYAEDQVTPDVETEVV